jgi:hypothetical protein
LAEKSAGWPRAAACLLKKLPYEIGGPLEYEIDSTGQGHFTGRGKWEVETLKTKS